MSDRNDVLVRLLPSGVELRVRAGERVLDALDASAGGLRGGLPTACRAANCGICQVRVVEGAEALAIAGPAETRLLGNLKASPERRLGCQVTVRSDLEEIGGSVVLETINGPPRAKVVSQSGG